MLGIRAECITRDVRFSLYHDKVFCSKFGDLVIGIKSNFLVEANNACNCRCWIGTTINEIIHSRL